jgi:UDP-N-acetylmuramoyl-L-alanyl-D-glutamate--2,6-diaminopimelate ligase
VGQGLVVDVAGFTQLGRDHLDLHGDEEAYFAAKASLFTPQHARRAVVTVDDAAGRRLAAQAQVPVLRLSASGATEADARVVQARPRPTVGFEVDLQVRAESARADGAPVRLDLHFTVGLPGRFNVANAALAATMLVVAGVEPDAVVAGLSAARAVPGRMEPVDAGQGFVALVDYAHTPDALASALASVRPAGGRLLVVLGCGGDRDVAKREPMGETAAALADVVVVTDDNPRSEDPRAIRASVLRGAAVGASGREGDSRPVVHEEADRGTAIAWAVARARPGDVVVVAGKGHETGQEVDGVVHPFDDRAVLAAALGAVGHGAVGHGAVGHGAVGHGAVGHGAAAGDAGEADLVGRGQDTPRTGVHRAPDNPEDRA